MSEKIEYEVREETPAEPKVILTVTVNEEGQIAVEGEGKNSSVLVAVGTSLIKLGARMEIKEAL